MKLDWYKFPRQIRFLVIGCINTGISYLIYALICCIFGDKTYQIALMLSWFLSSLISFFSQRIFVFRSTNPWFKEYIKCCGCWGLCYLINAVLLEFFVAICKINVLIAQIIANLLVAIITYILFKVFAFKKQKQKNQIKS